MLHRSDHDGRFAGQESLLSPIKDLFRRERAVQRTIGTLVLPPRRVRLQRLIGRGIDIIHSSTNQSICKLCDTLNRLSIVTGRLTLLFCRGYGSFVTGKGIVVFCVVGILRGSTSALE